MKKQLLTLDGAKYTICLPHAETDYIQGKIVSTKTPYEIDMLRDMASRLERGNLVLDVGANVGNHSLYLACVVGAKVEAFEPNTELCEALRASVSINSVTESLTVHQVGVSNAAGFAHFDRLDDSNLGAQSLAIAQDKDEIRLVSLDQFDWSDPVCMIKIDVEGMELLVLEGAKELLKRDQPILYIEAQDETDFLSINDFLALIGYQFCATFNATPTHLFMHQSQFKELSDLGKYLTEKAFTSYKTNQSLVELRTDLDSANYKYRGLNERYSELKLRYDDASFKYREVTSQILTLKNEIATQALSFEREKFGYDSKIERLELDKERTENNLSELNKELKEARQLYAQAQRSLSSFKASATYKAGLHVKAASTSFAGALKLPIRLWRLRKNTKTQPEVANLNLPTKKTISVAKEVDRKALSTQVLQSKQAKEIRVACIMDDFTFDSYAPECDLHQLTPESWLAELEACKPELLFIESAWRGKDELWGSKVGHCSQELQGIVAWCRERHIPTVFWNKEDPVHFETFLTTAKLFDFVFTTDMDCIHRYKAALGHEHVYFLPFACQPKVHNPIEKYPRKDAFCFAGAYYVRYPERTRDLESFVEELPSYRPLEIYDRNFGKDDPNYQFPEAYQPYIVGTLPFSEIDKAYKGYRYAINLNSIKQSQTMFARRVYELLGSNTLTISNFSRGVRLMFGDLVITSDSGADIKRRLESLSEGNQIERLRLAGLRKAMAEHTYEARFSYVLQQVTGQARESTLPAFTVLMVAKTLDEVRRIAAHIARQQSVDVDLTLVARRGLDMTEAEKILSEHGVEHQILQAPSLRDKNLLELIGKDNRWVVAMLATDYYGPHYLLDIALATRYSSAPVIGKVARYTSTSTDSKGSSIELIQADDAYLPTKNLYARCSAINPEIAREINAKKWLSNLTNWEYRIPEQLAIDPYNYCQEVGELSLSQVSEAVDDLNVDCGIELQALTQLAEKIEPMKNGETKISSLNGNQLAQLLIGKGLNYDENTSSAIPDGSIKLNRNSAIQTQVVGGTLDLKSELPDGKHEYLYAAKDIHVTEVTELSSIELVPIYLDVEPGLNISLVVLFLDKSKDRLGHQILLPNRNVELELPEEAVFLRFGLRVYAGGSTCIKRLLFGHLDLEPANVLGQSDVLLLTNHYPSYDDLYRNGFVHSRVKAYAEKGQAVDVFRLRKEQPISWHEFQDIDVTTGSQEALRRMLQSGRYRHVLVHFLDSDMWGVLKEFIDTIKVTVWVHGSEVQPWWRREYNYDNEELLAKAKLESEIRLSFWKGIFFKMPENLKFVFVSRYFADEVMEDVGIRLYDNQYEIIHNPIDTDIFTYMPKGTEQRKKILSIRPYASRKYANDLSVKAVLELSKEPFFKDLQFKFIGDGSLFDETLKPIKQFDNVSIERRFLSQQEIASMHKEYGVFLCPTRMDAQGVSKDEAMASGLVVVTNAVTAIPEFIDESCGLLVPGEDYVGMAAVIKELFLNEKKFIILSQASAARVRKQVDKKLIVNQEITLIHRE